MEQERTEFAFPAEAYKGTTRKGPPKGTLRPAPRNPEKVFAIVHMRDTKKMDWGKIGAFYNESRQAPFMLYRRWSAWAKEQQKNANTDDAA